MPEPPPDVVDLWTVDRHPEALREILARYLDVAPGEVPIQTTPLGKPELPPHAGGPAFSLSHTGDLALVAVAARPAIGVDIELADRRTSSQVMRRALSQDEWDTVKAIPREARDEVFLRHWTVKEAYVKALGIGLSVGMRTLTVADALTAPRILTADGEPAAWSVQRYDPRPGVIGAVVVAGPPWTARPRVASRSL